MRTTVSDSTEAPTEVARAADHRGRSPRSREQNQFATYDSNTKKYKYVPVGDTNLRKGKGYWVYANSSGNLTIPSVGGSLINDTYAWSDLYFTNCTDDCTDIIDGVNVKNISDANSSGWIKLPIFRYDPNIPGSYKYRDVNLSPGYFASWKGYFIISNQNNITLLRKD